MTRICIAACICLPILTGQNLPTTGTAVPELANLDTAMQSLMAAYSVPGAALAVAHNGKLVFARGYGYANTSTRTLVQPDSLFRIASVTKPHTAAAILKLTERNKLSLNDKAFQILSNLQPLPGNTQDPRIAQITIQNLLDHKSGWYGEADGTGYDPLFDVTHIAQAAGVASPANPAAIVRYMLGQPLDTAPGTYYSYSNFGYLVLGQIIEKVSGESYESFVAANVLGPIGNRLSQFGATLTTLPGEVTYYPYPGQNLVPSVLPGPSLVQAPYGSFSLETHHANGGLVSNTVELVQFLSSINGSRGPSLFRTPVIGFPSYVPPAGRNWNWIFHGSLPGNNSSLVLLPDQTVFCYLTNTRPANSTPFFNDFDSKLTAAIAQISSWPTGDQFPLISSSFSLLHAATYIADSVSPDQFVTIYGNSLAKDTSSAQSLPLPTSLSGASITFVDSAGKSFPAPLVYASPTQINLIVPAGVSPGVGKVTLTGASSLTATVQIDPVSPGIFTANASGTGVPAALAARYSAAGTPTPVPVFQCPAAYQCAPVPLNLGVATDQLVLSLFGTGMRHVSAASNVKVTVKGLSVPVLYAGPQGEFAGLDQVNVQIPISLKGAGVSQLQLIVDGQPSNTVSITIQ